MKIKSRIMTHMISLKLKLWNIKNCDIGQKIIEPYQKLKKSEGKSDKLVF